MRSTSIIGLWWLGLLLGTCGITRGWAQTGADSPTYESIGERRAAETREFMNRKKALQLQPESPQRELQLKQEVLRHQAETKKLATQQEAIRRETIADLKQKWSDVGKDWQVECDRHKIAQQELAKLPDSPDRTVKINEETASHRAKSKEIAVNRNAVHEGVLQQANREVMGGTKGVSNEIRQTAGTKIDHPDFNGMNSDFDTGGGYRTTEKTAKILDEIGVKDSVGGKVKVQNGVLETSGDFGMTVNVDAAADRVGSSGHQAQVKQGAANPETYVSEMDGAVQSKTLKDDLATLDHSGKAKHGMNKPPAELVGSPDGRTMVKGALKAANQAGLPAETIEAIARKNGVGNPDQLLEKMADIKAGRSTIANAEEAAKLQGASRDLIEASQAATKAKAEVEIKNTKMKVLELEAQGKTAEAQRLREEVADYHAKADASNKALAEPEKGGHGSPKETKPSSQSPKVDPPPVEKSVSGTPKSGTAVAPEPAVAAKNPGTSPKVTAEPVPKTGGIPRREPTAKAPATGKLMGAAGLALGAYGIYEGYKTASEEMAAKKQGEPQGLVGRTANKAELAGRTLWHGLGFGAAAQVGEKAGKDSLEQYKKDLADKKVAPDSWVSYSWMKVRGVLGGIYGGVKAISYDAAKSSGTALGEAAGELVGVGKDNYDLAKNTKNESLTKAEQSKKVYDTLVKNGASPVGAQRAADGVLQGDFTEAKRLTKVLDDKRAAKLAAIEKSAERGKTTQETLNNKPGKSPADQPRNEDVDRIVKGLNVKEYVKGKMDEKAKADAKKDPAKLPIDPSMTEEERVKALLAAKDKEVAQLRDAIDKTRAGLAKLKALNELPGGYDDEGTTAQVEAALARMTARYQELTGEAVNAKPIKPAGPLPPKTPAVGGTVTHADGSKTVLTYRKDAAGNRVPITTDYDRNGRVMSKTTVDNKGKTVPVR